MVPVAWDQNFILILILSPAFYLSIIFRITILFRYLPIRDKVYRSEDIHNNLNPTWKEAALEMSTLCGGDMSTELKIMVFDHESSGKHKPMGEFVTSVQALQKACQSNEGFKLKHKGKEVGTIFVTKADVSGVVQDVTNRLASTSISSPSPAAPPAAFVPSAPPSADMASFVDYVAGGCEINVSVAIDFTGSNGDPRKAGTLHYMDPSGQRNDYEKAIAAIVSLLGKYDHDQKFPCYGFGAKYGGVVRHCFQVGNAPELDGVQGILDAYRQVFKTGLVMSSPTVFNDVIRTAAARANAAQSEAQQRGEQCYTILLIVTDGAVSDVQSCAATLNEVSDAPLSIVIVGVGNANFSSMQFLDDASAPGKRDIAQFVEFNKYKHDATALTTQTLDEIPDQLTSYFRKKGIAPRPATLRSDSKILIEEEEEIDLSLDITEDEIVVSSGGDDFVDGFAAGR